MQYLLTRFGANSTGGRTEATARLQRSYFDPRATMSVEDVSRQYNEISQAAADILASGGQPPDSQYMISLFENAMPPAYAHIRQMLRFKRHTDFQDYYTDLLEQVKAEVKSTAQLALGAFAAHSGNPGGDAARAAATNGNPGMGTNPCFNCGSLTHTRDKCPVPKVKCKHCGGGHMPTLCPRGSGSSLRDSLSGSAKRALARSVKSKGKERAHIASSDVTTADADDAMLAAQFKAYRAGKAARTSPGAGPSNAPPPAATPPPLTPLNIASDELVPPDEMEEFMSAIGRSRVMVALRRDQCPNQVAHIAMRSGSNIETIACVDSQASTFVVPSTEYLLRITDAKPSVPISTANGDTYPEAIGVAGIHLVDDEGKRHYFEIDGVVVLPQCDRVLYSWPEMVRCDVKHFLDDGFILMPNGGRVPIMPGLAVRLTFGPPPHSAHPANIRGRRIMDHEGEPISNNQPAAGRGSDSTASVPQSLLWQRLGFPSEHAWRHSREVLSDHGLPSSTQLRSDFGVVDAVARARARALPFHKLRDPTEIPAPGSTIYTDFAGPMCESYPHKFSYYCGVVDAGSGYSRLFACHGPTKEVAKQSSWRNS